METDLLSQLSLKFFTELDQNRAVLGGDILLDGFLVEYFAHLAADTAFEAGKFVKLVLVEPFDLHVLDHQRALVLVDPFA